MLGWLFGRQGKGRQQGQEHLDAWAKKRPGEQLKARLESLSPAKRKLYLMAPDLPEGQWLRMRIEEGDDKELMVLLQNEVMPKVDAKTREQLMRLGAEDAWATTKEIIDAGHTQDPSPIDSLTLGWYDDARGLAAPLLFHGEGHLLTVAMTGAGKGQGHILPNLFTYTGSAVVFDPKGEAYKHTAWRRQLYGKVFKWAPFDKKPDGTVDSDSFNPLDCVEGYNDALVLADLLVDPTNYGRDQFWDRSARDLLVATILFVKRTRPAERQNMREVMRLLSPSEDEFEMFADELRTSGEELLVETANEVEAIDPKLRTSIYQTLRSHLGPWRSPEITATTSTTHEDWAICDFRYNSELEEMMVETGNRSDFGAVSMEVEGSDTRMWERGMSRTAYIVIPPHMIKSYAPVLRVMLGMHLQGLIDLEPLGEDSGRPDKPSRPVLFILDELPQLGYMKQIEQAIATARSAKIRLWLFAQDLNQLRQNYEGWETIVANCRVKSYFKVNDMTTAQYIADRVGKVKSLFGGEEYAASPQEIMGSGFKNEQIIEMPGMKPIRSRLRLFYDDSDFQDAVRQKEQIVSVFGTLEHAPTVLEENDSQEEPKEEASTEELRKTPETPTESVPEPSDGPRPPSFEK